MNTDEQIGKGQHSASRRRPQVTEADLRQLLQTGSPGTRLIAVEGEIRLAPGVGGDEGGLQVVTRGELADRIGDRPDDSQLAVEAELLNTEIRLLGA
ncbi:hypothetical protein DFR68_106369 [Nocardia mexicana]|uniref:Uncharacterized protein n=1 Tax=Nocardia mexicana TaxID=279262 RepID=A0A370H704_9NOCA|nr:hypothetical protein DFR68_106369 [Nocardia mexicana]